ncbi:hypothetical protein EK21DRAFT_104255 [Setomelanomma holmii]|uniref:lytic cellulose monooxygenase (C4-dehydrogenating) n=1 Tax=Setomelanomma holmii TaxID=210430 RepID=A0A9P4GZM4_9PLEO|nr:hypothetical protein EK21DRAFT_104255 [Setomelanomma holmii]
MQLFSNTFPRIVVNGEAGKKDRSATRQTNNANCKQGIENPTVADIRCYSSTNANVITVPAGATIHYISTQQINHPGPTQYYLAKVPSGADVKNWDGSGAVWFKISTTKPSVDAQKQMTWPGQTNKAQFYLSCTQVRITTGGNGAPGPLVAFPGAYKSTDPGILVDLGKFVNKPDDY